MKEIFNNLRNERRPLRSIAADISLLLIVIASLGHIRTANITGAPLCPIVLFGPGVIGIIVSARAVWRSFVLRRLPHDRHCYVTPYRGIDHDADTYAKCVIVGYIVAAIAGIAAIFAHWSDVWLVNVYLFAGIIVALSAIVTLIRDLYQLHSNRGNFL